MVARERSPRCPSTATVYLTLGTIMNNKPGVMEAALTGIHGCRVNVVMTTGRGFDKRRLGAPTARVLVRKHIGQATVLPRCSAVISHAGSGTMFGAMSFGLPQLALPMGADQPFNAATLERGGAGLRLDPADLAPELVGDGLTRLLDEPTFTASARRLQGGSLTCQQLRMYYGSSSDGWFRRADTACVRPRFSRAPKPRRRSVDAHRGRRGWWFDVSFPTRLIHDARCSGFNQRPLSVTLQKSAFD